MADFVKLSIFGTVCFLLLFLLSHHPSYSVLPANLRTRGVCFSVGHPAMSRRYCRTNEVFKDKAAILMDKLSSWIGF